MDPDTLKQVQLQQSAEESMHAEKLANRIIQLVGTPVMKFDQLFTTLKCFHLQAPSYLANLQ